MRADNRKPEGRVNGRECVNGKSCGTNLQGEAAIGPGRGGR